MTNERIDDEQSDNVTSWAAHCSLITKVTTSDYNKTTKHNRKWIQMPWPGSQKQTDL